MLQVGNVFIEVGQAYAIRFLDATSVQCMFPGGIIIETGTEEQIAAVRAACERLAASYPRWLDRLDVQTESDIVNAKTNMRYHEERIERERRQQESD